MKKVNNVKIKYIFLYALAILGILTFGMIVMPAKASAQTGYDTGYGNRATLKFRDVNFDNNTVPNYNNALSYNMTPVISSISPNSGNLGGGAKTVTISGNGFIPNSVARWNGSSRPTTFIDYSHLLIHLSANDMYGSSGRYINVFNPAPDGGYSNAVLFTINGYVTPNTGTTVKNSNTSIQTNNTNLYRTLDTNTNSSSTYNASTENSDTATANESSDNYSSLASNVIFGSNSFYPSGLIQWIFFAILVLIIVILVRKIFGPEKNYHSTPMKHA